MFRQSTHLTDSYEIWHRYYTLLYVVRIFEIFVRNVCICVIALVKYSFLLNLVVELLIVFCNENANTSLNISFTR